MTINKLLLDHYKTEVKVLRHRQAFPLECGQSLPEVDIAYCTYGTLSPQRDNVIWICHALTANADVLDWWDGLVGIGKLFDPKKHFIVCANMLGSCYGSTCPSSVNPLTNEAYGKDFPLITIRDIVRAHQILCNHLKINKIKVAIGGSMGGQQVLEWAIIEPDLFENIIPIATNAKHSPWAIAFNESQRMALEADPTLFSNESNAGINGLEAARAIAMLSYRHYKTYDLSQQDEMPKIENYRAGSYQRYQGLKLRKRFEPLAYYWLSKAMDSQDVGRARGGLKKALKKIKANTLVIGIKTDILFPISEQKFLAKHIKNANLKKINSDYGHDGFLIEYKRLSKIIRSFLQ